MDHPSTAPDDPTLPCGIEARCERGHTQRIATPGMGAPRVRQLAGLIDGTSELFVVPPRDTPVPGSTLARCGICGSWMTCTLYGYDQEE